MKLLYIINFSLFTFLFSFNSSAQPTFSMDDIGYQIGDVIEMDTTDYVDVSGMTGPNMIWDFNDILFETPVLVAEILAIEDVESPFDFVGANMVSKQTIAGSEFYHYHSRNDNDVQYHGYFAEISENAFGGVFENSELQFSTPMTYGSTDEDTYNANIISFGLESPLTGESSYEIVGYGTLMMNNETYNDVLLMHLTKSQTTLISGFDSSVEDDIYTFFKAGYHMPLLSFNHSISTFGTIETEEEFTGTILLQQISVGVEELETLEFNIYPNPTYGDKVTIQFTEPISSVLEISLVDPLGRKHLIDKTNYFEGNNQLQIQLPKNLSNGIYQLTISGEKVYGSKSIIVR